ncbi:MAG: ABC transporter permease [Acidimicrobiales bacterium]
MFSVVFTVTPPSTQSGNGRYFSLYLFVGLVVWNHVTGLLNGCMGWLASVSDLRKKIFFPTETALLGGAIAVTAQTLLEVGVLVVILILLSNLSWTIVLLPIVIFLAGLFGLGIGFVVSILNAQYRDVSYLVGIALNLGFYATPIVFTVEYLEGKEKWGIAASTFVDINPFARFVVAAHDVGYVGVAPSAADWLVMTLLGLVPFAVGLIYFRSRSMAISEEL